jgi:hypothetical protein
MIHALVYVLLIKKNILNSIAGADVKRYEFAFHEYCSCVARMQEGQ